MHRPDRHSYLALTAEPDKARKSVALSWYLVQLVMIFFGSLIFFRLGWYTAAFIWLVIMYIAIIICTVDFFLIDHMAGWLMIPYNLWMAFAAYLNLMTAYIH